MSFFSGEYECKLDAKGRLVLPARIKSNLPANSNEIVLRKGFEPCLVLYPQLEYERIYSKISGLNEFNEEARLIQRNFFRGISQVELDNMGRFLIPKSMLVHASLEKDALIVGIGTRAEIWNPEQYEQYLIKDNKEFSSLTQKYVTNTNL
jgi:MraZ protein